MSSPTSFAQLPACSRLSFSRLSHNSSCLLDDVRCICADNALYTIFSSPAATDCSMEASLVAQNMTNTLCGIRPRNNRLEMSAPMVATMVLAGVFVSLYIVARKIQRTISFWWDDAMIALGFLLSIATSVIGVLSMDIMLIILHQLIRSVLVALVGGKDAWAIPHEDITTLFIYFWTAEMVYTLTVGVIKTSILFLFLRTFPNKRFRFIVKSFLVMNAIWALTAVLVFLFQCDPVGAFWIQWRRNNTQNCISPSKSVWAASVISIGIDIGMLAMPISQLWGLQLAMRRKILATATLSVGVIVTVISVIRLYSLRVFEQSINFTYDYPLLALWSTVEVNIGIVCACLPRTRALLVEWIPKLFEEHGSSHNSHIPTGARFSQSVTNLVPETPSGNCKTSDNGPGDDSAGDTSIGLQSLDSGRQHS